MKRWWFSLLALGLMAALTMVVAIFARKSKETHPPIKTVVVSSSGQNLVTLFDGSPVDRKFSAKSIIAKNAELPRCGQHNQASLLQSIFGPGVVYANCLLCSCGGSGWMTWEDNCNFGYPCSGNYDNVRGDPGSPLGYLCLSTHCGLYSACGCDYDTC